MTWSLKWGDHVKAFELQAKKTGIKPKALNDRPRLVQRDLAYYNAFNSLNRSRQSGGMGGSSPILVSEILAYCQLVGIANSRERVKYLSLVQDLDQICLTHWAEEQKKKNPSK